jgi:hypothetical protein
MKIKRNYHRIGVDADSNDSMMASILLVCLVGEMSSASLVQNSSL